MFTDWFSIIFYQKKPEQVVKEKSKVKGAFFNYLVALLISQAIMWIAFYQMPSVLPTSLQQAYGALYGALGANFVIVMFFLTLVFAVIINYLIDWVARAFGGKGETQVTVASLFSLDAAFNGTIGVLASLILLAIAFSPGLGSFYSSWAVIAFILSLYLLFLKMKLLMAAHNLSWSYALGVILLTGLIFGLVISAVIGSIVWASLTSMAGA